VAGASHNLVCAQSPSEREYLWNQIAISLKLHEPDEILIIDHQDCGMYKATGEVKEGMSLEDDKQVHKNLLLNLNKELKTHFPKSKVKLSLWFASLDGKIKPMFD
jgi:carbonic anhydrase